MIGPCRRADPSGAEIARSGTAAAAGFALVGTLLLLVALLALVGAMWLGAVQQHALTRGALSAERARLAAAAGVEAAVAGWRAAELARLAPLAARTGPSGEMAGRTRFESTIERLSADLYRVRGRGMVEPPAPIAEAAAATLVRSLDPDELAARFDAGLETAGDVSIGPDAILAIAGPQEEEEDDELACPATQGYALRADPRHVSAHADATVEGAFDGRQAEDLEERFPSGLGFLDRSILGAVADATPAGSVTPAPRVLGSECRTTHANNWGDPLDPASPCADWTPLLHAPGDLLVQAGTGQGVLLVDGDLTLADGAVFHGLVIVLGRVVLEAGAQVRGAIVSGRAQVGGRLLFDRCAVARALRGAAPLSRAWAPAVRYRLPAF